MLFKDLLTRSKERITALAMAAVVVFMSSCGSDNGADGVAQSSNIKDNEVSISDDPMSNKGVGPVAQIDIPVHINPELAAEGQAIFDSKCASCHHIDERYVGPPMRGLTESRTPEWIMNMILNPEEMTRKDPIAKKLFEEYLIQMVYQDVSKDDTRAILEYLRQIDAT